MRYRSFAKYRALVCGPRRPVTHSVHGPARPGLSKDPSVGQLGTSHNRPPTLLEPAVPTNRRNFLKASAVAAGALGLESLPSFESSASAEPLSRSGRPIERAKVSLNILILGGTGFTGPEQ